MEEELSERTVMLTSVVTSQSETIRRKEMEEESPYMIGLGIFTLLITCQSDLMKFTSVVT